MAASDQNAHARETILALLRQRDEGKTICPSDVARALAGDRNFRPLMDPVRAAAAELAADGVIEVTQGGRRVEIEDARGPIRLGLRRRG